jgi:hypothetical protein
LSVTSVPFLAGILTLGWVPIVTTTVILWANRGQTSSSFQIGLILAAMLVVPGAWHVWYYNERLIPTFHDKITDTVLSEQRPDVEKVIERYDDWFANRYWAVAIPWMLLVVLVFFVAQPYLAAQGIDGPFAADYVACFVFFVYWGFFAGMGFHGGITTVLCIRSIAKQIDFDIDPYHPDGQGGLSAVGYYAVRTTFQNSTGSLGIPLSIEIASSIGSSEPVYFGIGLYVLLLAVSFLYPTHVVNREAQLVRNEHLEARREQIHELRQQTEYTEVREGPESTDDVRLWLAIEQARQEFHDYQDMNLYPVSYPIMSRLVSSLVLPLVVTVIKVAFIGFS